MDADSPARSPGDVSAAVVGDDIVGAVLEIENGWDLEGGIGVDEIGQGAMKRRILQLQEFRRAKNQRVPANMLEVFILATELVEEPVTNVHNAMERDTDNTGVSMADPLKRVRKKAENAKMELAKITENKEEVKETHNEGAVMLREERVDEIVA